ncbi:cyclin N-terminal domain-containing protein [Favolaschia claudopus]|uniref:Cyclin N-terminal domain-containing protein n=1 Tax=Favolaschia claudopus TaxID=2862362 RepID=A0AAW0D2N6_9AGAR
MSTNPQPRRAAGRTTRNTALKDNENANARPSRINTRAKPLSVNVAAAATNVNGVSTRATATTAASRAKTGLAGASDLKPDVPVGKRKREVLGENTAVAGNRSKNQTTKGKEKEGVVKKDKLDAATGKPTTVRTTRQPLRVVAGKGHNTAVDDAEHDGKLEVREDLRVDEHAMLVDLPPQPALPVAPVRRSLVAGENTSVATRHSTAAPPPAINPLYHEVDVEDDRAHKRRKTSSDFPEQSEEDPAVLEEARLQAEEELIAARIAAELDSYANDEPEADPETSPWDDLDADDADDPVMVSEYVTDIFQYLKQVELTTMPNPNYICAGVLNDWLIQLHVRFRLLPETLFLCVNIIDRFLSARVVSLAKLQLVGVTCMFIAAKFEEIVAPSVIQFQEIAEGTYTESEILQAERYVLKTLDWNLSFPSPVHYLRRISKADDYNLQARTVGKYLIEIACLEWRLIAAPPSLLAAAAIWLARISLGDENWTPNLAHYSSYPESALLPTANLMLNYILKPTRHESFHLKYSGKKFSKASVYMRQWALERWEENTLVDLPAELAQIKAEIRAERVHEQVRLEQEELRREKEASERAERRQKIRGSMALVSSRSSTQRVASGSGAAR